MTILLLLLFSFLVFLLTSTTTTTGLILKTTAKSTLPKAELQEFLATPSNWPKIVASSNRVSSSSSSSSSSTDDTDDDVVVDTTMKPMSEGSSVTEYFGLNLLSVTWTCEVCQPGKLVFRSPTGLAGIANNCVMDFEVGDGEVTLTMGYNPLSPIAILATPILTIDNWAALNVFLPAAVSSIASSSSSSSSSSRADNRNS